MLVLEAQDETWRELVFFDEFANHKTVFDHVGPQEHNVSLEVRAGLAATAAAAIAATAAVTAAVATAATIAAAIATATIAAAIATARIAAAITAAAIIAAATVRAAAARFTAAAGLAAAARFTAAVAIGGLLNAVLGGELRLEPGEPRFELQEAQIFRLGDSQARQHAREGERRP
jgi:hypothetical protein